MALLQLPLFSLSILDIALLSASAVSAFTRLCIVSVFSFCLYVSVCIVSVCSFAFTYLCVLSASAVSAFTRLCVLSASAVSAFTCLCVLSASSVSALSVWLVRVFSLYLSVSSASCVRVCLVSGCSFCPFLSVFPSVCHIKIQELTVCLCSSQSTGPLIFRTLPRRQRAGINVTLLTPTV